MHNNSSDQESAKLLLRGREVAQALSISRALAYQWMSSGILPTIRRGRIVRVPSDALAAWIASSVRPGDVPIIAPQRGTADRPF